MRRLALFAALLPALAQAQYLDFKMVSTQSQPFNIWFGNNTSPAAGLDSSGVAAAHAAALNTWNAVSCASPKMYNVPGGASSATATPGDTWDNFSVSPVWVQQNDPDFYEILGTAPVLAITIPRSYAGVLKTCDIFFNAAPANVQGGVTWSTAATIPPTSYDFETVQLHELGHCLGLDENGTTDDAMYGSQTVGRMHRGLSQRDIDTFCARNPSDGGFSAPCTGDGGCDVNLKCLPQPTTNGTTGSMCTRGCQVGTNESCEALTCASSSAFSGFSGACMRPGDSVTHVGEACAAATTCGSATAGCQTPVLAPSGAGNWWQDGYCTQECSAAQPCPSGATCFTVGTGINRCVASCRVGYADCRAGYVCAEIDDTSSIGLCLPRCFADADCAASYGAGYECRACDGQCVATGNPLGTVGTACSDSTDCGAGLKCFATAASGSLKQCTQPCALGCGLCPTGSTCTPAASGQLVCMKNCEGKGLCPQGGRCVGLQQGRVCQTPCNGNRTGSGTCPSGKDCCAVGETCAADGECYGPDAGPPCVGCHTDGGQQYVPGDGGTGPNHTGTGGCGCTSVEPLSVLFALGLLVLRRRNA